MGHELLWDEGLEPAWVTNYYGMRVSRGEADQSTQPSLKTGDPVLVEPADLVKCRPEFGGLVDVDLARLLGIRLAELLVHSQALQSPHEHASLACQIGGAVEAEVRGKRDLVRVQQVAVGVAAQIDGCALPVHLEAVWPVRQRVPGRAQVGQGFKVLILSVRGHHAARGRIGCETDLPGRRLSWRRRWVRSDGSFRRSHSSRLLLLRFDDTLGVGADGLWFGWQDPWQLEDVLPCSCLAIRL
jgi:hypothetical protein